MFQDEFIAKCQQVWHPDRVEFDQFVRNMFHGHFISNWKSLRHLCNIVNTVSKHICDIISLNFNI